MLPNWLVDWLCRLRLSRWSDREIARRAGVAPSSVAPLRAGLSVQVGQIERIVERNGTTYTQDTANIGKPVEPTEPEVRASSEPAPVIIEEAANDNAPHVVFH